MISIDKQIELLKRHNVNYTIADSKITVNGSSHEFKIGENINMLTWRTRK